MSKTFKFEYNIPLTFTPKYNQGRENPPPDEHPEWGNSFSWGVIVNGEDGFINVTPMLNDILLNAGIAADKPITVCKREGEGKKVLWEINGGIKTAPVTQPVQKATTPQSAPKQATQPQISSDKAYLAEQAESTKENWIKYLACLKATNPIDSLETKILEAVKMERVLRRVIETRVQKKIEVMDNDVKQFIADLDVPF